MTGKHAFCQYVPLAASVCCSRDLKNTTALHRDGRRNRTNRARSTSGMFEVDTLEPIASSYDTMISQIGSTSSTNIVSQSSSRRNPSTFRENETLRLLS